MKSLLGKPVPEVTLAVVWLLVIAAVSVVWASTDRISLVGEQLSLPPVVNCGPCVGPVVVMAPVVTAFCIRNWKLLELCVLHQYKFPLPVLRYWLSKAPVCTGWVPDPDPIASMPVVALANDVVNWKTPGCALGLSVSF